MDDLHQLFPGDNRVTAANHLLVLQQVVASSLEGIACVPADLASPEEWHVIEAELQRARTALTAATRGMLAMLEAHR